MTAFPNIGRFTVVTGHYGCGKTNLSINLALDLAKRDGRATLVDLDVVNPYFRSSDYTEMLAGAGVRVISPTFAGTTLDVPALPAEVGAAFEGAGAAILDVGGDDAGATALGQFAGRIGELASYGLLYVINRYRTLTSTPEDAAALLAEIESASRLRATGVINNSHLRDETTPATILDALPFARETARLLGLPLVATTVPAWLAGAFSSTPGDPTYVQGAYPVEVYVRMPWERDSLGREEVT